MNNKNYEIEIPYAGITLSELQIFSDCILDADRQMVIIKIQGE